MINYKKIFDKIFVVVEMIVVFIGLSLGIRLIIFCSNKLQFKYIDSIKNILSEYQLSKDITGENINNLLYLVLVISGLFLIAATISYIIDLGRIVIRKTKGFDEINIVKQGNAEITYGIIHGNNTIVFIKAGMNGTYYGYKNKYLRIAKQLNRKHGCTVITASNPNGYQDDFESEMKSLKTYAYYHKWQDYQVYYMGHSNGASLGMIHAYKYPEIKKLVCINGPLMINPQTLIPGIQNFNGEKMNLIYGSKDPSFGMLKTYSELESDKVEIIRVNGASHNFGGCLDLFMALPGFFFFKDKIKCKNIKITKE